MRPLDSLRVPTHGAHGVTTAAVALMVLSSCSSGSAPKEPSVARQTKPTATASSPALDRFYGQRLAFGPCKGFGTNATEKAKYADPYECARLTVPLDYAKPGGRTMQVAVLRLPAKGSANHRIGSLVLNPGGPGGSGMLQAVGVSERFAKSPLRSRFDIVGFDPRGVGSSTPTISCFSDGERDRGADQTTLLGTSGQWSESDTRALVARCAKGSGGKEVLSAVGSRDVARDMDVLRAALGDEKLTFAGQSYGTRLGAVYAEMFPRNIRAMVLDGVIDPTADNPERRLTQQAGFQRSFDSLAAACAKTNGCPLGRRPGKATRVFQRLVQPLISTPVPAGKGRTLNFNQATGGVTAALYYPESWPTLIKSIANLAKGDGALLLAIYGQFGGRDEAGVWSNYIEANLAINCDDEKRRSPAEEAALRAEITRTSPFLATGQPVDGVSRDACEFWPGQPTLRIPYATAVPGLPRTLVVSVTGDPSTPYAAGQVLADALGSSLLTVEGERHTVAQDAVSPCVNDVFTRYLIDLEVPGAGKRCRL